MPNTWPNSHIYGRLMPPTEEKISVHDCPVQLEWTSDVDNAVIHFDEHPILDFSLEPSTRKTFFRFRVSIRVKDERRKAPFYVFIKPEDMRVFAITNQYETTLSLRCDLIPRPSTVLAGPRSFVLTSPRAIDTLDLLKSLCRTARFSFRLTAAQEGDYAFFRSATALFAAERRGFRTSPDEYLLERLYKGAGDVQIDYGAAPPGSTGSSSPDPLQLEYPVDGSPPLYDEVSPSPPPARRRRRGSSRTYRFRTTDRHAVRRAD
ncbi:hypothetical protein SLS55_000026 [Diplodia seriata]|uniref:Uncharacterized protein n=1 Tax=Diplodia seriata TaxID=420778 RepID=A0ABR3CT68_9PEZI